MLPSIPVFLPMKSHLPLQPSPGDSVYQDSGVVNGHDDPHDFILVIELDDHVLILFEHLRIREACGDRATGGGSKGGKTVFAGVNTPRDKNPSESLSK